MLHYKALEAKLPEHFDFAWCRRGWRDILFQSDSYWQFEAKECAGRLIRHY